MKQRWTWALALFFFVQYAVTAWFEPLHDSDLAWQRWLGAFIMRHGALPSALGPEAFAAHGAPWVPQEWALSLAVSAAFGTPWFALLALVMAAAAAGVVLLAAAGARRLGAGETATALCAAAAGFSMWQSFGVRAQVLGWFMLALLLFIVRGRPSARSWWSVPVVAVWANLHASAVLAPALLAIRSAGVVLEERAWNARVRHHLALTAAAAAATCLTPLGMRLPLYAFALFRSPIRAQINEWQAPTIHAFALDAGVLPLVLVFCVLGFARPFRWSEIFTFATCGALALAAGRNIPVAAIAVAPLAAQRLSGALPARLEIPALVPLLERIGFFALAAAGSAAVVALSLATSPVARPSVPLRAMDAAAALPGTHRLYCEDFAWCSWALAHANLREFIDGRCDPFPSRVWKSYEAVYELQPTWRAALDANRIDLVLASRSRPLAQALALEGGWRRVYTDSTYALFIRRRV